MENRRLAGPTRAETTDYEFGQGVSVLIENEINKRLDSLRKNPFDGYLYTKLEIASKILLGKPALHDEEWAEVVRMKSEEWEAKKHNKTSEGIYFSAVTALEYYLLTGRDIASKEELKHLKKNVEAIAYSNYRTLFEEPIDVEEYGEPTFDEDDTLSVDSEVFYSANLIEIAELGLIARYLGLDSIDGKYEQIIEVLEAHTKDINFNYLFSSSSGEDSILIMRRMADIVLIKDHTTKV